MLKITKIFYINLCKRPLSTKHNYYSFQAAKHISAISFDISETATKYLNIFVSKTWLLFEVYSLVRNLIAFCTFWDDIYRKESNYTNFITVRVQKMLKIFRKQELKILRDCCLTTLENFCQKRIMKFIFCTFFELPNTFLLLAWL